MKSKWIAWAAAFLITGCQKNLTRYYSDPQNQQLAIFSNTGNNIFTCYVNGLPWRTINRVTGGLFSPGTAELIVSKQVDSSSQSSLVVQWRGYLAQQPSDFGTITLFLKVSSDFTKDDIGSLQGQRFLLDSSNYFVTQLNGYNGTSQTGSGSIYFNKANYDSSAGGTYSGELSGLLEAKFAGFTITSGRFDHQLSAEEVRF